MSFFSKKTNIWLPVGFFVVVAVICTKIFVLGFHSNYSKDQVKDNTTSAPKVAEVAPALVLDTVLYDKKILDNANIPPPPAPKPVVVKTTSTTTKSTTKTPTTPAPTPKPKPQLWPVKTPYPLYGALLPFNRIVAYYGNFYSKGMGVLGQYPTAEMLQKLQAEVATWQAADPATPVIPAIDYIAVTAQDHAGADGKYRLRMPFSQIDHALDLAKQINGIVILDIQTGLSDVQTEIPLFEKYLKMPNVSIALDPEFSMKNGKAPGDVIGTMDASDINYTANYMAGIVKSNNLPPKVLVIHRFTEDMVTNYKKITPLPEVQMIMDMDGWGGQKKKIGTYNAVIYPEPVQFTGFKLFYKNDVLTPGTKMLPPADILKLSPQPLFIQYQ